MFLLRNKQNYSLIITKYPPLFHWTMSYADFHQANYTTWNLLFFKKKKSACTSINCKQHKCFSIEHKSLYIHFTYYTPQPLYNTIFWVKATFCVSYPNRVKLRVKCIGYIKKIVLYSHLGSNPDLCYIQNCVIMKPVI